MTLSVPGPAADLNDPALLGQLRISYDHSPIRADEYYDDPHCNQILHNYQQRFPDITFTFPCAALHCLSFFSELSNGRLLLLSGDKGHCQEEDLLGTNTAGIAIHGSLSMNVNYHAIGEYVCNQGGRFLHSASLGSYFRVCAYLLGQPPSDYLETAQSFHETIEHWGPYDFHKMRLGIAKIYNSLSVEELISYIRLCNWDNIVFMDCCSTLLDRVQQASKDEKRELYRVVQRVWEAYYHIGEEEDLAFSLGMLLHRMDYYREALGYYQYSLELYGLDDRTFYNMALCHAALQQTETALTCIERVLELDPSSQLARRMRIELQSQLTR